MRSVLSREWLEFEGGVISRLFNCMTQPVSPHQKISAQHLDPHRRGDAATACAYRLDPEPVTTG